MIKIRKKNISLHSLLIFMSRHKKVASYYVTPPKFWVSVRPDVRPFVSVSIICVRSIIDTVRHFHQTSHKCKAPWDDVQNTWTVTVVCLLLELLPFEHWTLAISTVYSCPLCKLETVRDILIKLLTNAKHQRQRAEHTHTHTHTTHTHKKPTKKHNPG